MIDKILIRLLIIDKNETNLLNKEEKIYWNELLIELIKIKYNIRYCTNPHCECHPEAAIKHIFEKCSTLKEFINKYAGENITENIVRLILDYKPIINQEIFHKIK